jgi:hypothetical protein
MVRRRIVLVSVICLLAASLSVAQQRNLCERTDEAEKQSIAELRELRGNVLVSDREGVTSGNNGQRLRNKVRVTTTSNAGALVVFDCGCDIRLKENERIDVELPRACAAILASVQAVPVGVAIGVPAVGATAPVVAGSTAGLLTVGAVGVGGYIAIRNKRNVSPN